MAQDNKKTSQKKIIPNLNGTEDDQKKRPKFNIYWIYGLLFASIIGYNLFRGVSPTGVETNIESFKEMVKEGDVSEIKIIRNKKIVRVYVLKDSIISNPGFYNSILKSTQYDAIFKVHLVPIKISQSLDVHKLAEQTPGFAGADIANVCNEAALIAARKGKNAVDMSDFQDAIDRVIGGLEKKNKIILPEEKEIIAYHEAGHAICGWYLEHAYPLLKVTIVPRGTAALGYAQYTPKEQYLYNTDQLLDQICMTLGGRASESIFFGKISTGASNDLLQITKMAYAMVTVYGMNDKIGNISYHDPQQDTAFMKPFSEETGKMIDEEVRKIIDTAYERTKALLTLRKNEVEILARELLKTEVLFKSDVEQLIGKRPYEEKKVLDIIDNPKDAVIEDPTGGVVVENLPHK